MTLEAEGRNVEDELAALARKVNVVTLHPAAVARYLAQIDDLSGTLNTGGDLTMNGAAASFRALVQSVIVYPVPPRAPLQIEVRGYLAELTQDNGLKPAGRVSGGNAGSGGPIQPIPPT